MPPVRLQKVLADAGIASRRKSEEIIQSGRVRVNGQIVREMGTKVDPVRDRVEVDGKRISAEAIVTIIMNKPRGVVCTRSDPEGRATVIELVKGIRERLYPVGRLDFATSGALLLTNDGDLSYALTHPKHGVEKKYLLKIRGRVSNDILDKWRTGVNIGDATTRPAQIFKVEEEDNFTWIEITLKEGRNRQIRRMGEATGLDVVKLKRISFAGITIEKLRVGQYRYLTQKELSRLKRDYINPSKRKQSPEGEPEPPREPPKNKRKSRPRRTKA